MVLTYSLETVFLSVHVPYLCCYAAGHLLSSWSLAAVLYPCFPLFLPLCYCHPSPLSHAQGYVRPTMYRIQDTEAKVISTVKERISSCLFVAMK